MIVIKKYSEVNKGLLKGKFNIEVPKWGNFFIKDLTYFVKENQRWIAMPSKQFEVKGEKKYMVYCGFEETKLSKSFQEQILKALDEYLNKKD